MRDQYTKVKINDNFYVNPKETQMFAKELIENLPDLNPAVEQAKATLGLPGLNQRLKKENN